MTKVFLVLFFIVSIGDLLNVWFELPYRHLTKSLIIPMLILYFIASSPKVKSFYPFVLALFFAWLGDVFLLFSGTKFFLLGLGCFLIMQGIYSFIFLKERDSQPGKSLITAMMLGFFSIGFNYYLWPFTTEIRVTVIVYSIAIAIMAYAGISRGKSLHGYNFVFIGVILFVISDTVLAINSFADGIWNGGPIVMLTYILAQFFIVEGYSKHLRSSV